MLELNKCQLIETRVENLASDVVFVDEGTPMIHVLENGVAATRPAAGASNEVFVGLAIGRSSTPTIVPRIERRTIPASSPYTINLEKPLNGSAIGVFLVATDGTKTALTAGTPGSNATDYSISNGVVTFNSAQAGKTVEFVYNYAISLQEAMVKFKFDAFAPATAPLPTIGLCPTGELFISNFDPASNWGGWTPGTAIKLGNGMLTLGGSGVAIPAIVTSVPGVETPFLGVRLNAGN